MSVLDLTNLGEYGVQLSSGQGLPKKNVYNA